jgi:methylmalonyl-CoA/ethylmalonyl-CoA epimerase
VSAPLGGRLRFDHAGIVVSDMRDGRDHLCRLLPLVKATAVFHDTVNQVDVQFFLDASNVVYETISPNSPTSPVRAALDSGKNILNHLAYRVANIEEAVDMYRSQGCMPLGQPSPAIAFKGARIVFLLTPLHFILELIESFDHQHDFSQKLNA